MRTKQLILNSETRMKQLRNKNLITFQSTFGFFRGFYI